MAPSKLQFPLGGEFWLAPEVNSTNSKDASAKYVWESGRAALIAILRALEVAGKSVLISDYICSSVVDAVLFVHAKPVSYEIGLDLLPRFSPLDIDSNPAAVIVVNYFGLLDSRDIVNQVQIKLPGVPVVVDHVQAPFEPIDIPGATAVFTSLRKAFAVPGGSYVYAPDLILKHDEGSSGALVVKRRGMEMKWRSLSMRVDNESDWLRVLQQGEEMFDQHPGAWLTDASSAGINGQIDFNEVKEKRRRNAEVFLEYDKIKSLVLPAALRGLEDGHVPLFLPIMHKRRDKWRRFLAENRIFLPIHWPKPLGLEFGRSSLRLYNEELSLVVDQRYTEESMRTIADSISILIDDAV